jgi:two-component system, OmpR family, sensor kinase
MKKRRLRSSLPYLIAMASLMLTLVGWFLSYRSVALYNQARFQTLSNKIRADIGFRMQTYVNTLLQTRNMIAVSPYVSRGAFKSYVQGLNFETHYPGMQGIGYLETIRHKDLKSHISQVKSEGFPKYDVYPKGKRDHYYAVTYLEPQDALNDKFMGFDMFTDDLLREAMLKANLLNAPTASGIINLSTKGKEEPGFVIFVPIYKNKSSIETESLRTKNLVGFLFSVFKSDDLFEGIFKEPSPEDQIGYSLETTNGHERKFYDHTPGHGPGFFDKTFKFEIAGEPWVLKTYTLPIFKEKSYEWISWLALGLGGLITLILFQAIANYTKHTSLEISRSAENANLYRQAQEAIKVRDEFMGIASHELKTPITSLKLQLEMIVRLIRNNDQNPSTDKQVHLTVSAQKQVSRLISLIENLLDASRISAGKLVLNLETVDVTELSHDILDRLQPQINECGSPFSWDIQDKVEGEFDRLRLEQVIINLLTNAIKYGLRKPIKYSLHAKDGFITVQVEDQGVGISGEDLNKVFERYERIQNTSQASGLGLGLFILKQIVSAHGGEIELKSELEKGSIFLVRIPFGGPKAQS